MARARRLALGSLSSVVFLLVASSCGVHDGESPDATRGGLAQLAFQFPAFDALRQRATSAPEQASGNDPAVRFKVGTRPRSRPPSGAGFVPASGPLSVSVEASGAMRFDLGTRGGLRVERLGGASGASGGHVEQEGSGLVFASGQGIEAFLFAMGDQIEDVLVAREHAPVGYRLALPERWRLAEVPTIAGLVEVQDGSGHARLRIRTGKSWDSTGREVSPQMHVEGDAITWSAGPEAAPPVLIDPSFEDVGDMLVPRSNHRATLLPTGKVLLTGGRFEYYEKKSVLSTAELYDPMTGAFSSAGQMVEGRADHTATPLPTGEVLLAGGTDKTGGATGSMEVYDPKTGSFSAVGSLNVARERHSATLLSSGKVLLSGGVKGTTPNTSLEKSAELYDPVEKTVSLTGEMLQRRGGHTATVLGSGKVLIAGGLGQSFSELSSAEVYDPETGKFKIVSSTMSSPRSDHVAEMLPSGKVLLAGGYVFSKDSSTPPDLYDPATGKFETVPGTFPPMIFASTLLPSGKVLFCGGFNTKDLPGGVKFKQLIQAQVFDPVSGALGEAGSMVSLRGDRGHAVTLLPSGSVLITGGVDEGIPVGEAELYNSGETSVSTVGSAAQLSLLSTAVLPSGEVLLTRVTTPLGLSNFVDFPPRFDLYNPETNTFSARGSPFPSLAAGAIFESPDFVVGLTTGDLLLLSSLPQEFNPASALFRATGPRVRAGDSASGVLLPSGEVLVVGPGDYSKGPPTLGAELYDPQTRTFRSTKTPPNHPHEGGHKVIRLPSGKILVLGGNPFPQDDNPNPTLGSSDLAELYDPTTGTFTSTGPMKAERFAFSATLLPSGKVLITGLSDYGSSPLPGPHAELYDPDTGTSEAIGPMVQKVRTGHHATLLPDGNVLLIGGLSGGKLKPFAELYEAASGTFQKVGEPAHPLLRGQAVVLPSGKVLVFGTVDKDALVVETFDPKTRTFSPVESPSFSRKQHTSTLLPSGEVLMVGGLVDSSASASAERYLPASRTFEPAAAMAQRRLGHTATLLSSGKVLVTGGTDDTSVLAAAELFDPASSAFSPTASMSQPRRGHNAVQLPSGDVLVTGGSDGSAETASAEIYSVATGSFRPAKQQMKQVRSEHTSVLLPSGRVLLLGGKQGGKSLAVMEQFDPSTEEFDVSPLVYDALLGANLASGELLLVGDKALARVAGDMPFFRTEVGLSGTTTIATLASGDTMLFAGALSAAILPNGLGLRRQVSGPVVDSVVRLASGGLLGMSSGLVHIDTRPAGVRPATITGAPASMNAGEVVTIVGSGFTGLTAVGSVASPDPARLPLVAFLPASPASGGPVFGTTEAWSDSEIQWRVPRTVFRGPGFLHVYVNGVHSEGAYTVLLGSPGGGACKLDTECASNHCTEGICCDRACESGCETCKAEKQAPGGVDGQCGVIVAGQPPRFGCESNGPCGPTGTCDGVGSCTLPPRDKTCSLEDGTSGTCFAGVCASVAAVCNEKRSGYTTPSGKDVDCFPYLCEAGECLKKCTSHAQCAPGNACGVDGLCAKASPGSSTDPGACAFRAGRSEAPAGALLLGVLVKLARRRRGRREPHAHALPGSSAPERRRQSASSLPWAAAGAMTRR